MSATAWLIIAIVGFSLAGIALAAAVILFIKMNIPAIIGDLTGKTVAREIKAMRESNSSSGDKRFRPSAVNMQRGTLTEKVPNDPLNSADLKAAHASKRLDRTDGFEQSGKMDAKKSEMAEMSAWTATADAAAAASPPRETAKLNNATEVLNNATEVLDDNATEVLNGNATEVLDGNTTEVLTPATEVLTPETEVLSNETTVLSGTTVLGGTDELTPEEHKPIDFKIVRNVILTHSDEVIS